MMNELVKAAKDSLGVFSLWIDDEQYVAIINAILAKSAELNGCVLPEGWSITVEGERVTLLRPDGEKSVWHSRPITSEAWIYDMLRSLAGRA